MARRRDAAVLAVAVRALLLTVCLRAPGAAAFNWCYGEEWCRGLRAPVTENKTTWPPNVVAATVLMTEPGEAELRRWYLTGNATADAVLEETMRGVLLDLQPYPVSTRRRARSRFHEGHDEELVVSTDTDAAYRGPKPAFTQPGLDIDVLLGKQFRLECRVKNAEQHVIVWRRGTTLVSFAQTMASPSTRITVDSAHTLTVSNATWGDSGVFECGVGSLHNFTQTSTVNVMGPAVPVHLAANETDQDVAWNSTILLRCPATGRPRPRAKWLKRGVRGVLGSGAELAIPEARRHHSGTYVCVLSNGIGSRTVKRIKVKVQYPPEIQCSDESTADWKQGTIQVSISCTADARPAAHVVSWSVPGNSPGPIRLDSRSRSTTVGRYHGKAYANFTRFEFVIANFTHHDLGTYTIAVNNTVAGVVLRHNVTSDSRPVTFTSPDESPSETSFNVSFRYESHLPPLEIRLIYRNYHSDGPLNLVYDSQGLLVSPGFGERSFNAYAITKKWQGAEAALNGWNERFVKWPRLQEEYTVTLDGLEAASAYEVFVQVRNKEGWNGVEEPFQFTTKGMMFVKRQQQQQLLAQDAVEASTVSSSASVAGASLARLVLGALLLVL